MKIAVAQISEAQGVDKTMIDMDDKHMIDMIGRHMKDKISKAMRGKRDNLTKNRKETSKSIRQSRVEEIALIDAIKSVSLIVMSSQSLNKLMNKSQPKRKSSNSMRMKGQKILSQRQEHLPLKRNLSKQNKLTSTRRKMKKCSLWMKTSKVATTTIRYLKRIVILAQKQKVSRIHATLS